MTSVVQSVEVSYFLQMTEDAERVKRAVVSLLGVEPPEERHDAEGHFGNRIVWVRHHLTGEEAEAALKAVVSRMEPTERRAILADLAASLDEHDALYIRLSKQVLVKSGTAVLASSDPVRIRVKPRSHLVRGDPAGLYARLLEAGAD